MDRLQRWGQILYEGMATPFILIGIGHNECDGEVQTVLLENVTNSEVIQILREVADKMEAGG